MDLSREALRHILEIIDQPPPEGQIMYAAAAQGRPEGTYRFERGRWIWIGPLLDVED